MLYYIISSLYGHLRLCTGYLVVALVLFIPLGSGNSFPQRCYKCFLTAKSYTQALFVLFYIVFMGIANIC